MANLTVNNFEDLDSSISYANELRQEKTVNQLKESADVTESMTSTKTVEDINSSIDFADDLRKLKTPSEIEEGIDKAGKSKRKPYANVAAMIADDSIEVGEVIETVSYYDGWSGVGDANGGNIYVKRLGQSPNEDGGSVIYSSDGNHMKALFVNIAPTPFHFGAKGDAVWTRGDNGVVTGTDDTTAVKNMLTYISNGSATTSVNPDPKLGGEFEIPTHYSFRVTETLEIMSDNITAKGDGYLVFDHNLPIGLRISEAYSRLCVKLDLDRLRIISYQSQGTVIDVEDCILTKISPYIENQGDDLSECNGITLHAGQWVYVQKAKVNVGGIPLVIDPDNGRVMDHLYVMHSGFDGKLNGKSATDESALVLWNFYADVEEEVRTIRFLGNHLIKDTFDANSSGIAFRAYDTKGGARLTSNYNAFFNFIATQGNWTENVGCIIDLDHARNSISVDDWTHEPNGNGGVMFKGESLNAVWNIGSIILRGGVPDIAFNMRGKKTFNKRMGFITHPRIFGGNFAASDSSFLVGEIDDEPVKFRDNINVPSSSTFIDVVHNLVLKTPQNVSITPSWQTTYTWYAFGSDTIRVEFGTPPSSDETLYVNFSNGDV